MEQGQRRPWWRDAQARTRAVVGTFLALALLGILFPAFTNYLFAGDQRVLVVTMEQDATAEQREALKDACGDLPGVGVVPDRGDADPRLVGLFPVRFDIADTTSREYGALAACVDQQPGVRGMLAEKDGG